MYLTVRWAFFGKCTTQGSNFFFLPDAAFHPGALSVPAVTAELSRAAAGRCRRRAARGQSPEPARPARSRRCAGPPLPPGPGEPPPPNPAARRAGGRLGAALPSRTAVRGGRGGVSCAPVRTVDAARGAARSARRAGGAAPLPAPAAPAAAARARGGPAPPGAHRPPSPAARCGSGSPRSWPRRSRRRRSSSAPIGPV